MGDIGDSWSIRLRVEGFDSIRLCGRMHGRGAKLGVSGERGSGVRYACGISNVAEVVGCTGSGPASLSVV